MTALPSLASLSMRAMSTGNVYSDVLRRGVEADVSTLGKRKSAEGAEEDRAPLDVRKSKKALAAVESLIKSDFSKQEVYPAGELQFLWAVTAESARNSVTRSDRPKEKIVEADFNMVGMKEGHVAEKHQMDLVYEAYKAYASANSRDEIVEWWTREDDPEQPGVLTAPHHFADYFLMKGAFRDRTATDEDKSMWAPLHLVRGEDPQYNFTSLNADAKNDEQLLNKVARLYRLVVGAPRAPELLFLSRTVRGKHRLPTEWFKKLTRKRMKPGDSIITPSFMSTTLSNPRDNWRTHGPDSMYAETEVTGEASCCSIWIAVCKGVPMLPLGDFDSNDHAYENEVLLPPGVTLVYMGDDHMGGGKESITVHKFVARL